MNITSSKVKTSGFFFQKPESTCYGSLIHKKTYDIYHPNTHFCICGSKAFTRNDNGLYRVDCDTCTNKGDTHYIKPVAIHRWNASAMSQFPSRLSVTPFYIDKSLAFNVKGLVQKTNDNLYDLKYEKKCSTNMVKSAALLYVKTWLTWLTTEYSFLDDISFNTEYEAFLDELLAQTLITLPPESKRNFDVFRKIHIGISKTQQCFKYLQLYEMTTYTKIVSRIGYPNRLRLNTLTNKAL
jgi:hypothetical protein